MEESNSATEKYFSNPCLLLHQQNTWSWWFCSVVASKCKSKKELNTSFFFIQYAFQIKRSFCSCWVAKQLTQAGSSSSVDRFSSAVAALFTKTTHNISKPLLFLPASDRPHHCRWAHGGDDFSWGPPTQVLKSYIPSPFGCSFSSSSSCPIFLSLLILLILMLLLAAVVVVVVGY